MKTKASFLAVLLAIFLCAARGEDLETLFKQPPAAARPWVFWYWMNAAVSREGITADLEAMKAAGIGGAYLMPIQGKTEPPLLEPPVEQLTPAWWEMVRHAMREADRLGIRIAMQDCDGFATAGGPWITPELSMQKVVWSELHVSGTGHLDAVLPQPPTKEDYYRDIAVLAFPTPEGSGPAESEYALTVTASSGTDAQFLADKNNTKAFRSADPCWIQFVFTRPFTVRSITIRADTNNTYQSNRFAVESSDDGEHFAPVAQLVPPRHGWLDNDADVTHAIPPTTARYFRFRWTPEGSEPGAEDLDSAKWKAVLKVRGMELSSAARIDQFEGKSGVVSRNSPPTTAGQLPPALCVPLGKVLNISQHFKNGRLEWDAPAGKWTILRVGHTSTGHRNETGGAAKGLECDKLSAEAARVQFDHWFGEVIRQVGPELAKRVLTGFHVDSWECGSQNWSPVFAAEFQKRRGYDPTPYLPAIAGIPVQSADESERFLHDVRQTIAELIVDNFYGTMAQLAHEHGCTFTGECVAPVMVCDDLLHFKNVDVPMGEFWLRSPTHDKPTDMLDAISAAHIYGKPIVQAEAFTELREAWDETPAMLKPLGDRQYALGINRFVFHVFVHNPWLDRKPGMTLGGVGTFLQRDQTWWKAARAWVDYTARCQALLQHGRPVADIAVFTGDELPRRALTPDRLDASLSEMMKAGDSADPLRGYAYDSINADALGHAVVRGGRIELPGGASYALVVGVTPSGSVANTVAEHFVPAPFPQDSLTGLGVERDFTASESTGTRAEGIAWTHRALPDADIYFVSNQRDEQRTLDVSLRVSGRMPELWDAVTGGIRPAQTWRIESGRTSLPLRLDPHGSIFIVLRRAAKSLASSDGKNWPEPQPVDTIEGPWRVAFDPNFGGPKEPVVFEKLESWTARKDPGMQHYSGTAIYTHTFTMPESNRKRPHVWLELGRVASIAEVTLNGRPCGVAWTAPWRVEITGALRPGENEVRIDVTNTWANRLIGDHALPEAERLTWTNATFRLDKTPLADSGLLGPVTLSEE